MLIGSYYANLGLKRRVAVPKKFLKELGNNLIVAKWYEGCLVIVNMDSWEALLKKLTGVAETITKGVRDTDRFILGSAYEVMADFQGRIVIPSNLADYAKFGNRLVFIGLGGRVEIWDKDQWEEREKYVSEHASEFIEKLANDKK
jgi:MraZ protein